MNTKDRDVIFFDLNDTLVSTYYTTDSNELCVISDNMPDIYYPTVIHHKVGYSIMVERPWAHKLIYECVELVGSLNVAMLTKNHSAFVESLMHRAGFHIDKSRIFTSEDFHYKYNMFSETNNILVDDSSYDNHNHGLMSKVSFLNLKRKNLIQVTPFNPMALDIEDEDGWKPIFKQIKKVLKTKR